MTFTRPRWLASLGTVVAVLLLSAWPGAAVAAEAEPAVNSAAWYWEAQRSQPIQDPTSGADVATAEVPNPFCPTFLGLGNPTGEGCEEGRLPIEVVAGDYDSPDKITAIGFDLALIPLGSEIHEFTVTLVEADGPQSQPINSEGKELQACPVDEFFGDGEAREYQEAPGFSCSETDPRAEREEVEVDGEDRFGYTFDLTPLAEQWVADVPPATGVMLTPVKPEEEDFNAATDNNWRTVLVGAVEDNGIETHLRYTPGEDEFGDPFGDAMDDPGDFGGGFGGDDFGSTDDGGFGEAPIEDGFEPGEEPAPEEPAEPVEGEGLELAAQERTDPGAGALPPYVWLAIVAGMIGFSLMRSVVLENTKGIRPDGVLAQIREINAAQGRGIAAATATAAASRFAPLVDAAKGLGARVASLKDRLPSIRRG